MSNVRYFHSFAGRLCGSVAILTVLAVATAYADLPSAVASRVNRINTALAAIDQALERDQMMTAQRRMTEAERILKEIQDRYAGRFDEKDTTYVAMTERLKATKERLTAAEAAEEKAKAAGDQAKADHERLCNEWIAKLGVFIRHGSEDFLPIGADLNRLSPEDQAKAKAAFARAKPLFEEYQKVEFALEKTMELRNVESRLESTLKYYGDMEGRAAQEEACREWVEQLAPFVDVGMNSPRRLIAAPTVSSQQIEEQQALYEKAQAVFAAYKQAELPLGKTFRLEQLEKDMEKTLKEFPEAMAKSHAMISGNVDERLDRIWEHINRDTEWKTDDKKKPPTIMQRDLDPLREGVEDYARNVAQDDAKLVELRTKLKRIEDKNTEHRQIRAQRTFQQEDGFSGSELEALKKEAKLVAEKAHEGGKVFHVTVPSDDWSIENVVEFTDTTRTALRRRITRSVRAQASVKDADGNTWLQGIYLGQDRTPDGQWGKLQGHTTWTDPMVEANFGKFVPKE